MEPPQSDLRRNVGAEQHQQGDPDRIYQPDDQYPAGQKDECLGKPETSPEKPQIASHENGYQADAFVPGAGGGYCHGELRGAQQEGLPVGRRLPAQRPKAAISLPGTSGLKWLPGPVREEPQEPGGRYDDDPGPYQGGVLPNQANPNPRRHCSQHPEDAGTQTGGGPGKYPEKQLKVRRRHSPRLRKL